VDHAAVRLGGPGPRPRRIHRDTSALKRRHPPAAHRGRAGPIAAGGNDVAVIGRWSDSAGTHRGVVAINRDTAEPRTIVLPPEDLPPDPHVYRLGREDAAVETLPDGEAP
jgi:hypothetical protein